MGCVALNNAVYSLNKYCSVSSFGRAPHCHCGGEGIETPTGRQLNVESLSTRKHCDLSLPGRYVSYETGG